MSLSGCCKLFLAVVVISSLSVFYKNVLWGYSAYFWSWVVFVSVFIPYISFLIFLMIIRSRLYGLSKEVDDELTKFGEECNEVDAIIHRLKEAYDLSVDMVSQNSPVKESRQVKTLADKKNKR